MRERGEKFGEKGSDRKEARHRIKTHPWCGREGKKQKGSERQRDERERVGGKDHKAWMRPLFCFSTAYPSPGVLN